MTNLPPLHQALHDADDKEIADALRYLGRAERIAAALNAAPQPQPQASAEDVATMQAEITALQFRVDQQRILAGFGDTDLRMAREQRDTAYRVLRRIAAYRREHFANASDMAAACVQEARELFPDEDETNG